MELCPCVFWESAKEELEERVDTFTGDVTPSNLQPIIGVGPSDIHGLVEERMLLPVFRECCFPAIRLWLWPDKVQVQIRDPWRRMDQVHLAK